MKTTAMLLASSLMLANAAFGEQQAATSLDQMSDQYTTSLALAARTNDLEENTVMVVCVSSVFEGWSSRYEKVMEQYDLDESVIGQSLKNWVKYRLKAGQDISNLMLFAGDPDTYISTVVSEIDSYSGIQSQRQNMKLDDPKIGNFERKLSQCQDSDYLARVLSKVSLDPFGTVTANFLPRNFNPNISISNGDLSFGFTNSLVYSRKVSLRQLLYYIKAGI
ncbi:hypothetical protein [Pseudobacteriovorax antillogorgiicola]|uniref:Uncharacterized protein n=1 Tax=Pseudobacteriovorax antillogorgiicola TaxID=1513793 RepID=A0A1Y6B8E0_9BACT|nr:hypothetical protein [Pseudobacteriovorax antillogorgiicola]TCS58494.1 hypothetical protein EDD56_1027 [Pseudobacteriovorax antillogorgiicola]SME98264.1 hypothetical protein SAMN06296036_102436 [Pseudobacteriovorax antillogorgiicola]